MRAKRWSRFAWTFALAVSLVILLAAPVGAQQPRKPAPRSSGEAAAQSVVKRQVNINTASELQLQLLPHVTPQLAAAIVEYRQAHGGFDSAAELGQVPGVDADTLQALEPFVVTAGPTTATEKLTPGSAPSAGAASAGYAAAGSAPGISPLGHVIEPALRDVLGWQALAADPRGLPVILTAWSALRDVEGHVGSTWTPRSFAVGSDLGAVTGAQASIFTHGRAALDQSLPLLDGLRPLQPTADMQAADQVRRVLRTELNALVNEFGRPGGPRAERVDQLFHALLGTGPGAAGRLRLLGDRFAFGPRRVNSVAEEQNLTNFLILVDHVYRLRRSWEFQTQWGQATSGLPVEVMRSLVAVNLALQEIYFAMNSAFLGPAQRQTLELRFIGAPPLMLSDLLLWTDRFASQEGPRLIRDGGRDGVANFATTAETLARLTRRAMVPSQDAGRLPPAYRTPRVQGALSELAAQLDAARAAAGPPSKP